MLRGSHRLAVVISVVLTMGLASLVGGPGIDGRRWSSFTLFGGSPDTVSGTFGSPVGRRWG